VYVPGGGHESVEYLKAVFFAGSGGPGFFNASPKVILTIGAPNCAFRQKGNRYSTEKNIVNFNVKSSLITNY